MSVLTTTTSPPPPPDPMRRFSVDEYHQMTRLGILNEDDNVELLEGWIVEKMSKNPRHENTIVRADDALRSRIPADWRIRIQSAVTLPDSEPEPDLAVVTGATSLYDARQPGPNDIALLIEVAESSLGRDRGVKLRVYARARVAEYWLVNLIDNTIEVYSDPTGPVDAPAYRQRRVYRSGEDVPLTIGGQQFTSIPVKDILGR